MPSAKTVEFPIFHSLALFSVVLWVICISKVSKLSPTSVDQHGVGVQLSCDYHVTHLCVEQRPLKKTFRLIIFTRLSVSPFIGASLSPKKFHRSLTVSAEYCKTAILKH